MYVTLLKVNRLNGLTLCMLGNFSCVCMSSADFSKLAFFKRLFQQHYQRVKHFGSRSGPTLCWLDWVLIWVQIDFKGYQQMTKVAASKEELLVNKTFWWFGGGGGGGRGLVIQNLMKVENYRRFRVQKFLNCTF